MTTLTTLQHNKEEDLREAMEIAKSVDSKSIDGKSHDQGSIKKELKGPLPTENGKAEVAVDIAKTPDVSPDGGYGWVCVAAVAVLNGHTWGFNSAYGVFLAWYLANDVFPGATRLDYAFVGGLSLSQALIVAPLVTRVTRLYGTRTSLFIGVVLEAMSFIGASFSKKIWHLFLSQGVCFGWGMGFLFIASAPVVPQWFTKRRSLASGISAAGSGIGGLVYSLATQAMIESIGLPWAFRVLGIIAFVVNTVCSLLIKDRNKQIGSSQLSFDYHLFKRLEFLGLMAFGFVFMLGYTVLLFSLPNYAHTIGLTAKQGSIVGAIFSLGQAVGRPPIGYFSDTVGRLNMGGSMMFLCGLFSLLIWMFAKTFGVLVFFALIGGMVAGTYWAVVAPITAEVMGLKDLPASLSITWIVLGFPSTFAEAIGLEIVSFNHESYTGAILFVGCMYVSSAVFLWLVRTWKLGEVGSQDGANLGAPLPKFKKSPFVKRIFMWQKV